MTVAVRAPLADGAALLRVPSVGEIKRVAAPPPQLSGRVLLVEDGADNRLLIGALLQQCGLEVLLNEHALLGQVLAQITRQDHLRPAVGPFIPSLSRDPPGERGPTQIATALPWRVAAKRVCG